MIEQRTVRRFVPTRAGIINLWDYRDEEFLFVDGWLVLRGPNGSGKTKALEVLFPFVLDGRIEPRRLNPFASEDRTMKSNLLYRGQDSAHAYVWMEFHNGETYVTVGIGLRAHRHVDRVTRWHFVVDGRVGADFSLLDADDRPLNRRDLFAQLGPDAVRDTAEEYRHLVDTRLFGLGSARYEQLLDLVLTLRKPQLAKDLNPTELSRTLQRGLRPLDDHLLVEAAGSFDDMEAVARTLEGLVAADVATGAFLAVYSTYLRTHARAAADTLTGRRDAVGQRQMALVGAQHQLASAVTAEAAAADQLSVVDSEPGRLRAHLDSLKSSAAYQSHEQLADLDRHVHDLAEAAARAAEAVTGEGTTVLRRRSEWERASVAARDARATEHRLGAELVADAEVAGIAWTVEDMTADAMMARVSARVSARQDDVRTIREHAARLAQAERDHARAAQEVTESGTAVEQARQAEQAADAMVDQARASVREQLERWQLDHHDVLAEVALPDLPPRLGMVIDRAGEPGVETLREAYSAATAHVVATRRDELSELRSHRLVLADRRAEVVAERSRIAAERDDAPPTLTTRPGVRDGRPGAPLWRLVRFGEHVDEGEAAGIEAALHAAGLLDAWVHSTTAATADALSGSEEDGYLVALPAARRPSGRTLADVLVAEDTAEVPTELVQAVLTSIALVDLVTSDLAVANAIGVAGQYAQGVSVGRHVKAAPEYIGATARATRRALRIAECDQLLAGLDAEIDAADRTRQKITALLSIVESAATALPALAPIHAALRELDRAAATLRARQEAASVAAQRLDQSLAEQAMAGATLRRSVSERSLPAERVDEVAEAVVRFERSGIRLDGAGVATARAADAEHEAQARHDEAADHLAVARKQAQDAAARHQEKDEAHRTLRASIGAEADRVLAEAAQTQEQIAVAEAALSRAREQLGASREDRASARARVELGEQALADAVVETNHDASRLRPYSHPDLLGLLRCPIDLRWPARAIEPGETDLDPGHHRPA